MLLYDAALPAPNPRRVRIFLSEKGLTVPTQLIAIMKGEHKSPDYLALYPPGQVPALQLDDGTVIGESIAICRYFDGLHPDPSLFGTDPLSAAQIDMALRRIDLGLGQSVRHIWMHTHPLTARVVQPQYNDFGESHRPQAHDAMRRFDAALGVQAYVAGADFSMADIALLTTIDFAAFIGVAMPADAPALADWHARVSARASTSA